ncbi:MAG: enoyl-CoA hydratase/isomerase family protein [Trebonia sp.]|jgi:enoyl-CoA hydratase/carnithine racemase
MRTPGEVLRIRQVTPAYWVAIFHNPPLNVIDGAMLTALSGLVDQIEADDQVKVVVFETGNADYYLAHFDLTGASAEVSRRLGPTGLPITQDILTRLSRSPVVSIAKIRGRARGLGSEFVLGLDLRFGSRENMLIGQPEVGSGLVPGTGGIDRLALLAGRGRALEIVLGSDDFDGPTAELYGIINRTVADPQLDRFTDAFARRIAAFDRGTLGAAKSLVNDLTLPSADHIRLSQQAFRQALELPETDLRVKRLFDRGLQQPGELEERFGALLPSLMED